MNRARLVTRLANSVAVDTNNTTRDEAHVASPDWVAAQRAKAERLRTLASTLRDAEPVAWRWLAHDSGTGDLTWTYQTTKPRLSPDDGFVIEPLYRAASAVEERPTPASDQSGS